MIDITSYLCVLVCLVGLLLYFLASDTKPKMGEVGRLMFACGLLVALFQFASKTLHF